MNKLTDEEKALKMMSQFAIQGNVVDSINEKNSKRDKKKTLEFTEELHKYLGQLVATMDGIERWEATKKCECSAPKNDIKRSGLLIRRIAACIIDFENDVTGATLNVDLSDKNPHCC